MNHSDYWAPMNVNGYLQTAIGAFTIPESCVVNVITDKQAQFCWDVAVRFKLIDTLNPDNVWWVSGYNSTAERPNGPSEYVVDNYGIYTFHPIDVGREVHIKYKYTRVLKSSILIDNARDLRALTGEDRKPHAPQITRQLEKKKRRMVLPYNDDY